MRRRMMKSKIHRATVTDANLDYVGSISLDPELMTLADILEYEQVTVLDIDNGARFETYAIVGRARRGVSQRRRGAARAPGGQGDRDHLRGLRDGRVGRASSPPSSTWTPPTPWWTSPWSSSTTRCARPSRAEAGARPALGGASQ